MLGPARRSRQRSCARRFGLRGRWSGRSCWRLLASSSLRSAVRCARVRLLASRSGWRRPWPPSTSGTAWSAARGAAAARRRWRRPVRLCRRARAPWRWRCWCCRSCCRSPTRCACAIATSRAGLASSCCCRWGPACTRRPPGCSPALCVAAARAPAGVRLPGGVARLDAAAPLPRSAGVRLRPVRRLLPRPDLRRSAAPAGALLCFRLVNLVWIGTAVAIGAAAVGSRLRSRGAGGRPAAGRSRAAAGGVVALYATGGRLQFQITRADLARDPRPHDDDRPLRPALRAAGRRRRADVALTAEDLEFRYDQLHETLGVEPQAADHDLGVPERRGEEGPGRRRRHAVREAVDARDLRADDRFPSRRAAPRDGARVRGRRSATGSSACRWRGGGTVRCRCRRWPAV